MIRVEGRLYKLRFNRKTANYCIECNQPRISNRREPRIYVREVWIENSNKDITKKIVKTHIDINAIDKSFDKEIEEDQATGYR
tara:strand:- start:352 stop:600 length:249 start_codon:yes stop_codon:yes gene_type:complete